MDEGRGLLAVMRDRMRTRHLAYRTEQTYLQWVRRYIAFHKRRHPRELGGPEVKQFSTCLAVGRKVSASTQNQALQAILFLYRQVLDVELPWLENVTRAQRPQHLPVVLSREEVIRVLGHLLYGSGLPVTEGLRLRVKDLVVDRGEIIVRDAKGGKNRVTVLPATLEKPLRARPGRTGPGGRLRLGPGRSRGEPRHPDHCPARFHGGPAVIPYRPLRPPLEPCAQRGR
jgi:integrase